MVTVYSVEVPNCVKLLRRLEGLFSLKVKTFKCYFSWLTFQKYGTDMFVIVKTARYCCRVTFFYISFWPLFPLNMHSPGWFSDIKALLLFVILTVAHPD